MVSGFSRSGGWSAFETHSIGRSSATSNSDPLRVIWVNAGTPGKLGMTIAPGKKGHSIHGRDHDRDLGADLDRLKGTYGSTVLVSLIEDHELNSLGIPNLVSEGAKRGIHVERFPIVDMSTPSMGIAKAEVKKIADWLKAGKNVVIHCRGGNGRTGTIAACALVELGFAAQQAIKTVRTNRPNAVETGGQEHFVASYAASG
jgi:ADP-ribosyl-[dinitrogen reductase] hydrolase